MDNHNTFAAAKRCSYLLLLSLLFLFNNASFGQKKYQSLLWEITGNGIENPSYLYGTMHVSDKVAFYLGDPFFDALESVDQVALELEPELWFDEVLGGEFVSSVLGQANSRGRFRYYNDSWNDLEGSFKMETNINLLVQSIFKQDPEMANQLLFRFYDPTGNFEEDTWLDMYIYQSAKKLGKTTLGLETFKESMEMLNKSRIEGQNDSDPSRKLSNEERMEIPIKIESAYRNGDLDLLDSLSKLSSPPSYLKYILIERNKKFVAGLDTLIRQKPIFAGMGAAHLPGTEGCIEMLRDLGFTVKPVGPGKRDAKQKKKIENMVMKRSLHDYSTPDSVIQFKTPSKVYNFSISGGSAGLITMDIPNGSVTTISRIMTYGELSRKSPEFFEASLDSILYETIPGEIVSKKEINNNGVKGFDILNRTRRGDYHRSHIYFLPDEIIIVRASANGKKIKKGFANGFFSSIELSVAEGGTWQKHNILKGSLSFTAPGRLLSYNLDESSGSSGNLYLQKNHNGEVYYVEKIVADDDDILDFDRYELDKMAKAMEKDRKLEEIDRKWVTTDNGQGLRVSYSSKNEKGTEALFILKGLGYYSFSVFTNDAKKAERFFNSIKISNSNYTEYHSSTDSSLFYTSKIPWENDADDADNLLRGRYYRGLERNGKVNYNRSYSRKKTIIPPSTSDWIQVSYYRYSKYDFNSDKETYPEQITDMVKDKNDLVIDTTSFEWLGDTLIYNMDASDTATNRRYRFRRMLSNRSYYSITSTYDATLGESDFARVFRDNFTPIEDTLSFPHLFKETDSVLFEDLMSKDTNTFKNAFLGFNKVEDNYEDETRLRLLRRLNDSFPPLADDEQIDALKTALNDILYLDDSPNTIEQIKKIYRENVDSAAYQQQMLENLTAMKTKKGIMAAKELLLEEAPIGVTYSYYEGMFSNLDDSLELASKLYPEVLELTAYEEYKDLLIKLLSRMVDSGVVNKNLYRSYVGYFVREARAEFRRLSSNKGSQVTSFYSRRYQTNNYLMYYYWTLLHPYRHLEGPKKVFSLSRKSNKKHVIEAYASFRHNHDKTISDDICAKVLEKDKMIINYYILDRLGRSDYLNDSTMLDREYVKRQINNNWRKYSYDDKKVDSIIFISHRIDSIRAIAYHTYYYKYLKDNYGKKKWNFAVAMIKSKDEMIPEFELISKHEFENPSKTETEQFELLRKKLIAENRNNAKKTPYRYNNFGSGNDFR